MFKIFTNMLKYNKVIFILLVISFLISCSDFFEDDLTKEEVGLLSPVDNYKSTRSTVTFWWNKVDDATGYNFRLVTPSFDSLEYILTDSMVTGNTITLILTPGRYEWGVSAYNNSSSTDLFYRSFTIDSTSSLSGEKVTLDYPASYTYLSKTRVSFKWYKIPVATKYIFEIKKNDANGEAVVPAQFLTTDTVSLNLKEGMYYWSVQALNESSGSLVTGRYLGVDTTAPLTPVLYPFDDGKDTVEVGTEIVLKWKHPSLSIAPIRDSIIITTDSTFKEIVESAYVDTTFYNYVPESKSWYYWKVKSIDAAGNYSKYSKPRKFFFNKK